MVGGAGSGRENMTGSYLGSDKRREAERQPCPYPAVVTWNISILVRELGELRATFSCADDLRGVKYVLVWYIGGRVWRDVDVEKLISVCDRIPEKWNKQISVTKPCRGQGETVRDIHVASSARPRPAFHPGNLQAGR